MPRRPDWAARLIEAVEAMEDRPFEWGHHDCVMAALTIVEAMTGERPFADEVGRYKSAKGAARRIKAKGFSSIAEGLAATFEQIPVAQAQRGDLGLCEVDGAAAVLVCIGSVFVGPREPAGLQRVPASLISTAYRVA